MKRKLFVAALVLILALAMLPSFALADGPVATVNGVSYNSVGEALTAALSAGSNGGTANIQLLADIEGTADAGIQIPAGVTVVIDLNGHALVGKNASSFVVNYGNLTINDSTAAEGDHGVGTGRIYTTDTDDQGRHAVVNYGTLVINGGIFGDKNTDQTDANDVQRGNAVRNYGVATINGGAFTCCDNYTNGGYAYAIANGNEDYDNAAMTINYATVYGSINGLIAADGGTLTVKDGSYTLGDGTETNLWRVVYTSGNGVVNIDGGNYVRNCSTGYGFFGGDINIFGGNFVENKHNNGIVIDSGNVNIFGGTFNSKVSISSNVPVLITGGDFSDFTGLNSFVSGAATTTTDSGKTVVTLKPSDNAVASVVKNGQPLYYTSLNDAVAEARDGETVEVLKSISIDKALEIKNNITIDGNGNTVTADECVGLYIKANLSKLTVTELTLKGVLESGVQANDGTGSYMGIGTYNDCFGVGALQLTNVTIDGFSYGLYFGKNPAGGNGPYNENPVSVTANNLTVQNCYIKGAYFEKLTDSTFTSCKFVNNGTDETKVESGFRTWMCGVDINLKNGSYKNISFVGCTFTNNGANSGTALLIKARDDGNYGKTTSLDGATVSGCTFTNNHGTTPVVIGEPGKVNKTPVNVSIQSDVKYTNNVAAASNFTVTFNSNGGTEYATQLVEAGSEITLPTPSKSGYIFLGWRCGENTYNAGATVKVTADMAFSAVWGNLPDVKPDTKPDQPVVTEFPFYDVAASAWYYDAVKYVYDKGLMDGVDTHEFAPNATLTRAMVWTILARAEGVDTTGGSSWYAKAQEWVVAKGVSDGENPNAAITRQELVTMLYRLAGSPTVTGSLTAPDASGVSSWAKDAMLWAMNLGLVEGDENGAVTPTATATRAQAAALIMRYTAK
jgi:hypothetical protein